VSLRNIQWHEASRGFSATAEFLVSASVGSNHALIYRKWVTTIVGSSCLWGRNRVNTNRQADRQTDRQTRWLRTTQWRQDAVGRVINYYAMSSVSLSARVLRWTWRHSLAAQQLAVYAVVIIIIVIIFSQHTPTDIISFFARNAMHKRGLCSRKMPVCPSVCLSRSCFISKWVIVSSNFFTAEYPHHSSFSRPNAMATFRRDPPP